MSRLALAAFALVASVMPARADPIIVNGSFELGPAPFSNLDIDIAPGSTAITGWLVTGGGVDLGEDPWDASDGLRLIDLDGRNAMFGGIQQTFATIVGQTYFVSFDLSGNPGDAPSNGLPRVKQVRVSVDGFTQDYAHDTIGQSIQSLTWQSLAFSFVATEATATLGFMSLTPFPNSYGALIDNVQVSTVPEPSTLLLMGLGAGFVLLRGKRLISNRSRCRLPARADTRSPGPGFQQLRETRLNRRASATPP